MSLFVKLAEYRKKLPPTLRSRRFATRALCRFAPIPSVPTWATTAQPDFWAYAQPHASRQIANTPTETRMLIMLFSRHKCVNEWAGPRSQYQTRPDDYGSFYRRMHLRSKRKRYLKVRRRHGRTPIKAQVKQPLSAFIRGQAPYFFPVLIGPAGLGGSFIGLAWIFFIISPTARSS